MKCFDEKANIGDAFRGLTKIFFSFSDKNIFFGWGDGEYKDGGERGIPYREIYIGSRNPSYPYMMLSPYEIERLEYTEPCPDEEGVLTIVGVNGKVIRRFRFKDRSNMKKADRFNECLALYKKYGLGK